MIHFNQVSRENKHGGFILRNLHFSIPEQSFSVISGPSGSGKTSIVKLLTLEEKPTEGEVLFRGVNIHKLRRRDIPRYRQNIGVVFQDFRLLKQKTVEENISFVLEMLGVPSEEIEEDVRYALNLVSLNARRHHFPHELSGGEQQQLAIARAIVNQPELLIIDEPTSFLDKESGKRIFEILEKIHELGTTVLVLTHQKELPIRKARYLFLEGGSIREEKGNGGN